MNPLLWHVVWHFANGTSFFVGAAILLVAIVPSIFKIKRKNLIIYPLVLIAAAEILLSANPVPLWFYCLWSMTIVAWLIVCNRPSIAQQIRTLLQMTAFSLCCTAIAIELPYHLMPKVPSSNGKVLYVIGDSVSAGIGGVKEHPWPQILGQTHNIAVVNLAKAGAKVADAVRQAKQVQDQNSIVFIEIGGNDIFAPTPSKDFNVSLEQILSSVTNQTRTVIMLELPLLPLQNEYGSVQRNLAKKYGVLLIPKRFFVSILSSKGATVDLAHLSQDGHKLMAEKVWSIVNPAMGK